MRRTFLLLCVLAAIGCASGPDADTRRSIVRQLMDPARRQRAYDEIVSWQRYAGKHWYDEEPDNVHRVVVCPQGGASEPMYAVFHGEGGQPLGGVTLVTGRGEFVNFFSGANYLQGGDRIADLNGDGIVEIATDYYCIAGKGAIRWTLLVVVPVTPEQKPILSVGYDTEQDSRDWRWSVEENPHAIRLENRRDDEWHLVARFPWSSARKRYEGPPGGPGHDFIMFPSYPSRKAFEEFARVRSE